MGKEKPGFLTAKAISNRIKSKGLQRLRWYCQMCQKQCRDENGFKCHIGSEAHHRQMLIFDENPDKFMGDFTRVFMKGYLDILRRQFGGKRSNANVVYQEYIKEKEHVHMNSTKFTTLTGFINCLQKMGIVKIDNTEKGWFIEYIEKDPEKRYQEKKKRRMERSEKEDDEYFFELFEKHKDLVKTENISEPKVSDFIRKDNELITMTFNKPKPTVSTNALWEDVEVPKKKEDDEVEFIKSTSQLNEHKSYGIKRKIEEKVIPDNQTRIIKHNSVLDEIIKETEKNRDREMRKNYWLREGIVVRLIGKDCPPEFHKKHAVVRKVEDRYFALVKTINLESDKQKKIRVSQDGLMTVVPKPGKKVLIVNGAYRNMKALLLSIDKQKFTGELKLLSGIDAGRKLNHVNCDDFATLYEEC